MFTNNNYPIITLTFSRKNFALPIPETKETNHIQWLPKWLVWFVGYHPQVYELGLDPS